LENLYDRLTELLNEPDDGSIFTSFLLDVQQEPSISSFGERSALYYFKELGFTLKTVYGHCFQITLWIASSSAQDTARTGNAYSGGLPYNVESSDSKETVTRKFGTEPTEISNAGSPLTRYDVPPYQITFAFDDATGQMDKAWLARTDFKMPRRRENG
jgi:hypothetical protein